MNDKRTVLIAGATGTFKLERRFAKPDKAMTDEEIGKRLWAELARQTRLDP